MRGTWYAFNQYLSNQEVEGLVEECEKYPLHPSGITKNNSLVIDPNVRVTDVAMLSRGLSPRVFEEMFDWALIANRESFGFLVDRVGEVQYGKYEAEKRSKYKWHMDTVWANDTGYDRKLTVVVQLTDPSQYEGGLFEFKDYTWGEEELKMVRSKGTIIVFPSFLEHRVTEVTAGTRASLVGWVEGPKFR